MRVTFPFSGLWFALVCVASLVGTIGAWQAGDRFWMVAVPIAVFSGAMAYRRFKEHDFI